MSVSGADAMAAVTRTRAAADPSGTTAATVLASATGHRSETWQRGLGLRITFGDGAALAVTVATAALIAGAGHAPTTGIAVILAFVTALTWLATCAWTRRRDRGLAIDGQVRLLPPVGAAGVAFVACCIALALAGASIGRVLLLVPFAVGAAAGLAGRAALRRWATRQHAAGLGRRTVLLVGTSAEISALGPALAALGDSIDVLGACVTDAGGDADILLDYEAHSKAAVRTIDVLGPADRAQQIAGSLGVDTVLLTGSTNHTRGGLSALAWQLDQIGTSLSLLSSTNDIDDSRVQREAIGATTLVHITRPTYRGALKPVKRLVDVAAGLLLLALAGLPMLAIAAVIRLTSRGGALFRQERVGLAGEHFTMLKFRSMVVGAEELLPEVAADQDAGNAVMFKMRHDPRVTKIGRLLRRTSLDELPQLINVLRGDMSLVGPRPPLPSELAQYDAEAQRRFLVKPGITGLWQVSGRSDLTWEQTVRYDRRYVENWSLGGDAKIVARTIRAMNKGAY